MNAGPLGDLIGNVPNGPNLHPFLEQYPELSMEMHVRDRMGELVAEGFDVGVHIGPPAPPSLTRLMLETRVLTCASPSYVDRCGMPQHPSEIASRECILIRVP